MQSQVRRVLLSSALLVALFAIPLYAQTFGEVTGHISDASGAAVPDAKIALTNVATNAVRRAVSTDSHALQFRLEAFNALNHPNWGMPNLNVLSGAARPVLPSTAAHQNFGVVTGTAGSMRQTQLGLEYSF
jgi:hypothetical protein